jgi:uncharacterized membrane protein
MRSIEEIEAVLTVMGVVMFYVQSTTSGLWWAQVDEHRTSWMDIYTGTTPLYTIKEGENNSYFGLHKTKQEACNAALDKFIGKTK